MPRVNAAPDFRFARLSRSGRGFALNLPNELLAALGWRYPVALELWVSGDTLHVHAALTAREGISRLVGPTGELELDSKGRLPE